jgi:N-acetylglucosaminyldiphosphoundecaprenol N-acetyl-beta-D-mannosaminyltransferase
MKIEIAGVLVDNVTAAETLNQIENFVRSGLPHHIVTTYSEFVVEANKNEHYKNVINNAALSLPDGIGIIWAARFLSLPKKNSFLTIIDWFWTLCTIILSPQSLRSVIKEQVTGSRLIWDIAKLAEANGFSLALVGGQNSVAEKSAQALKNKFPDLKINLAVSDQAFDKQIIAQINASNSDILMIAYQPPKQEIWLSENLDRLNTKVAIGLGGTFDYVSGLRLPAPDWMHKLGLEWLWRLITQPWRIKRMWQAIIVFSVLILKSKLQ